MLGDRLVPLGRKDLLGQDLRDARGHLVLRALLGLRAPSLSRAPIDKVGTRAHGCFPPLPLASSQVPLGYILFLFQLSVLLGRQGHRGHQDLQAVLMCLLG